MDYLWKKFEEETGETLSRLERDIIYTIAVDEFTSKNVLYWKIDGLKYSDNPDKFIEKLLRLKTYSYLKSREVKNGCTIAKRY